MPKDKQNIDDFSKPVLAEFIRQNLTFGRSAWLPALKQIDRQIRLNSIFAKQKEISRKLSLLHGNVDMLPYRGKLLDQMHALGKRADRTLAEMRWDSEKISCSELD